MLLPDCACAAIHPPAAAWVAAVADVVEQAPAFTDLDVETREHVRALLAPIVRGGTDLAVTA